MSARPLPFLERFRAAQGGATALELAFVLPVFVAMLFGTFQFGFAQHKLSSIRYALNTVSRSVMLNPTMTQVQAENLVKAQLATLADPNVTVTLQIVTQAQGKIARMTGTYTSTIGVPHVATYPLSFQTTVDTALPSI